MLKKATIAFILLSIFSCTKEQENTNVFDNINSFTWKLIDSNNQTFKISTSQSSESTQTNFSEPLIIPSDREFQSEIIILNTSNPNLPINVSQIIKDDEASFQIFYDTQIEGTSIEYADFDVFQNPVGLKTIVKSTIPNEGIVTIIIKENINKFDDSSQLGIQTNNGNVLFQIDVPIIIE